MFLWFCPQHGHCYGYHVIPSAEGRKDALASLYKYLPACPDRIFYDNACQLSEYCLNREPSFFRSCRFHHDLFHSFNHTCGDVLKSNRFPYLKPNSEICEQFNVYLQRVKCTEFLI